MRQIAHGQREIIGGHDAGPCEQHGEPWGKLVSLPSQAISSSGVRFMEASVVWPSNTVLPCRSICKRMANFPPREAMNRRG